MHIFLRIKKQTLEQTGKQTQQPSLEAVTKSLGELVRVCVHWEDRCLWNGEIPRDRLCVATELLAAAEVPAFMPSAPATLVQGWWDISVQPQLHSEAEQPRKTYCMEEVGPSLQNARRSSKEPSQTQWSAATHIVAVTLTKQPLYSGASWMNISFITWSLLQV